MAGMRPEDTRVVVQGSGNVGGIGALLLHRAGYKIVSLSDMYGTLYNAKGLDVPAVLDHLRTTRRLEGFAEGDYMPNGEQLELDCEVLVPAAFRGVGWDWHWCEQSCLVMKGKSHYALVPEKVLSSRCGYL